MIYQLSIPIPSIFKNYEDRKIYYYDLNIDADVPPTKEHVLRVLDLVWDRKEIDEDDYKCCKEAINNCNDLLSPLFETTHTAGKTSIMIDDKKIECYLTWAIIKIYKVPYTTEEGYLNAGYTWNDYNGMKIFSKPSEVIPDDPEPNNKKSFMSSIVDFFKGR